MSWSVSGIGKSDKLGPKLSAQIKGYLLSEPEKTVANAAADLITTALAGNIPATAVKVHAFGSQSTYRDPGVGQPERVSNTLEIKIEQLGDFVE